MGASLGDLMIRVGGNIDGFRGAMSEGASVADAFSNKITSSISQGITLFDAYGRAVEKAAPPTENLTRANEQLAAAAERVIGSLGGVAAANERVAGSSAHAVTEVQAVSAAIRTFDGNGGIRAAERFIASVLNLGPAFQSIFAGVGLIAVGEILLKIGENAYKAAMNFFFLRDAEQEALEIGKKLAGEAEQAFEHTAQLQAEALRNSGKLVAAAKLEQEQLLSRPIQMPELDKSKFSQLDSNQNKGEWKAIQDVYAPLIPTEIPERIKQINDGIARTSAELEQIKKSGFDPTGLSSHFGSQDKVELELYGQALQFLQIKQREFAAEMGAAGQKIGQAKQEETEKALEAVRKQSEALKAADEDRLATLKANHQVTIGETISFWRERLAAESGNAQRVHEIGITLGSLYQEQDKAIASVAAHGAKLMEEQARKAEEWQSKLEALAFDAQKLIDSSVRELDERTTKLGKIGAQSEAQGQEGAADFKKLDAEREYGALLFQTNAAHLAMLQKVAAAEQEIAQAKIDALEKEQQAESDPVKKAELGLQLQEATIQAAERAYQAETRITEEKRKQSLQGQLATTLTRAPAAIGNSLAAGIVNGKNIGQDIANSLRGIGQQMLGNIFQRLIATVLQQIASHVALIGVLSAHMGVTAASAAATTANATSTGINTAATAVNSATGVGNSVATSANTVATVAQTVASAAGGLLGGLGGLIGGLGGGLISGLFTMAGDNKIVHAINATTAAVESLRTVNVGTNNTLKQQQQQGQSPGHFGIGGFLQGLFGLGDSNAIPVRIVQSWGDIFHQGLLGMLGFADGGSPPVGVPSMVGEQGPELFIPREPGTIIPNGSLRSFAGRGNSSVVASNSGHTFNGDLHFHGVQNVREMMRAIANVAKTASPQFSPAAR